MAAFSSLVGLSRMVSKGEVKQKGEKTARRNGRFLKSPLQNQ